MAILLVAMLCLHVVTSTFWAGSTFVLAREGRADHASLLKPQMGAAAVAFLTGAVLWHYWHQPAYGRAEIVLTVGVVCAALAAATQLVWRSAPARSQRVASLLLVATIAAMVSSRFAW